MIIASLGVHEVTSGARLIDPGDWASLHAVERSAVSAAVPARRAEFASGRALLRSLIGHDDPYQLTPDYCGIMRVKASSTTMASGQTASMSGVRTP